MKKFQLIVVAACLLAACNPQTKNTEMKNPLLTAFDTPFGVPPFDKIENAHYMPAFEEGFRQHNAEIEAIAGNREAPSFANTIEAFDAAGRLLGDVSMIFFNLKEADTNDEMDKIAEEIAPKMSQHSDEIMMNEKLFERVKSVYDSRENLNLTPEQSRLLSETYKGFVRGGANLPANEKEQMKKINEQLSLLELKFGTNMLAETNNFVLEIDKKEDLAGLPESVIVAAAETAKEMGKDGKWIFTLQKPSWIPFMTYSEKRDLREKLYKAMYNRGNNNNENDNKELINQMVNLRLQKAKLMGYENWSAFMLIDNMAKNQQNVYDLLHKVWTPGLARAKAESKDIQALIKKEGGKFEVESWDWWYYAEKVRKEKYDLDEEQLKPYFEVNHVRDGMFMVATKLYGLTFHLLNDMPVFHPECEVFEVKDADGSFIGILYMDYFVRPSKGGGAWMTVYREQSKGVRPVVSLTCNYSKPSGGKPALLTYDDVETMFHEFGHGLHGLLSKCNYKSLAGTNVPRDFVELPSQIMEHWAAEPEVLKAYAKHYETGAAIPQQLIDKMVKAGKFNQGFATTEFIAAALLDMDYHTVTQEEKIDVTAFEKKSMDNIGLIKEIIPRYRSTYFAHIFSSIYSSGYYSYTWAEVLDADAFDAFKETGDIFNPQVAKSFRTNILERGNTDDPMTLYLKFRGKEPGIEPLLRNRGLLD